MTTRFPPGFVQRVLNQTDLHALVGSRVKLTRKARDWAGLCPFHKEKTPSFYVIPDKQFFHCFGCGASGNAISWLQRTEGLDFVEAATSLAERANIAIPKPDNIEKWAKQESELEESLRMMDSVCRLFEAQLRVKPACLEYLDSRGVTDESREKFRLGFCPENIDLKKWAQSSGFNPKLLADQGLVNQNQRPRFGGRLMFPISDQRGQVIAFGGRAMEDNSEDGSSSKPMAKYVNSRETSLFDKGRVLYNAQHARRASSLGKPLIVVEGYMDCIAMVQAGFEACVAPMGTALGLEQLRALWRINERPLIAFDGDDAGKRAADRLLLNNLGLLSPTQMLEFINLPTGLDPANYLQRFGTESLKRLLNNPQDIFQRLWLLAKPPSNDNPDARARFRGKFDKLLDEVANNILKQEYRRAAGNKLFAYRGGKKSKTAEPQIQHMSEQIASRSAQILCYGLLCYPELLNEFLEQLAELNLPTREAVFLNLLLEAGASQTGIDNESLLVYIKQVAGDVPAKDFLEEIVENRSVKRLAPFGQKNDLGAMREFLNSVLKQNHEVRVMQDISQHTDSTTARLVESLKLKDTLRGQN